MSDELGAELLRCLLTRRSSRAASSSVYGPEVSVPEDASDFDRALGLSGRDPRLESMTRTGPAQRQRSRAGSSRAAQTARQMLLLGTPSASAWTTVRLSRSARLNSDAQTR